MISADYVATTRVHPVSRLGDRFLGWLTWVLLGYALLSRSFAYVGVNPLFIGEVTLLFGVAALYQSKSTRVALRYGPVKWLVALIFWGLVTTLPHVSTYGVDSLRDAVLYGYGIFMLIVAGVVIQRPDRLRFLLMRYRPFILIFFASAWLIFTLYKTFKYSLPLLPGTTVTVISAKPGDLMVHITGCCAFLMVGMGRMNWKLALLLFVNLAVIMVSNRGGMVAFVLAMIVVVSLRPPQLRLSKLVYGFLTLITVIALWNPAISREKGRDVSLEQVWENIQSIFGETDQSALKGTKEWRLNWWTQIVDYTFFGEYFLMGKGFGINLANSDGYQVEEEDALRSPHNGHMTMLARAGVPGFILWLLVHASWAWLMLRSCIHARRRADFNWAGIFLFLLAYWLAFMVNTSFDVFLEGPMGGIWFWTIMGAGIAAVHLYRYQPQVAWDDAAHDGRSDQPHHHFRTAA